MQWLWQWFMQIYAFFAVVPFISFVIIWFLVIWVSRDRKKATALSVDITTFLLVGSVSVMMDKLFSISIKGFWLIALLLLLGGGLLGSAQNRKYGKADPKRIMRAVWRISFLALSVCYLIFVVIILVQSVQAA
ncbi:DUF3397 domain-containing protein [Ferviditalea candida]|uniref:DUF3397 domain-containing protein n=1 Tax=Ferviditalea candida TaxID=3108399 RepID=A0ABU5ZDR9_9BACL|nr:DUF3397 domain-containing protein [Paenibacillaceae bacterium T2]